MRICFIINRQRERKTQRETGKDTMSKRIKRKDMWKKTSEAEHTKSRRKPAEGQRRG